MENKQCSSGSISSRWVPAAFIALGLLFLGVFIRGGFQSISSNQRVVTVRGLCEKEVTANKVTWPIVSKEVGNDLNVIYQNIQKTNSAIVGFLKSNGITDSEISVNAPQVVDMQADRYNSTPAPFRYNVTTVVVVTSAKVEAVNKLMTRQTELLKEGMIAEATKNAREAAKKFAEDSDSRLGKIKTASQGQFSIENRDQYTPYIKRIRVVSTIDYFLKD